MQRGLDRTSYKQPALSVAIMGEIYRAVESLGGDSQILGSIGSYGDTLPPEMVLSGLKAWNEDRRSQAANDGRKLLPARRVVVGASAGKRLVQHGKV